MRLGKPANVNSFDSRITMAKDQPIAGLRRSAWLIRLVGGLVSAVLVIGLFYFGGEAKVPGLFQLGSDKLEHFALFFALGAAMCLATRGPCQLPVIVVVTAIGAVHEGYQLYVPGRQADAVDLLADVFGALAAVAMLCLLWQRRGTRWRCGR